MKVYREIMKIRLASLHKFNTSREKLFLEKAQDSGIHARSSDMVQSR